MKQDNQKNADPSEAVDDRVIFRRAVKDSIKQRASIGAESLGLLRLRIVRIYRQKGSLKASLIIG